MLPAGLQSSACLKFGVERYCAFRLHEEPLSAWSCCQHQPGGFFIVGQTLFAFFPSYTILRRVMTAPAARVRAGVFLFGACTVASEFTPVRAVCISQISARYRYFSTRCQSVKADNGVARLPNSGAFVHLHKMHARRSRLAHGWYISQAQLRSEQEQHSRKEKDDNHDGCPKRS